MRQNKNDEMRLLIFRHKRPRCHVREDTNKTHTQREKRCDGTIKLGEEIRAAFLQFKKSSDERTVDGSVNGCEHGVSYHRVTFDLECLESEFLDNLDFGFPLNSEYKQYRRNQSLVR